MRPLLAAWILVAPALAASAPASAPAASRAGAVTFDDLPAQAGSVASNDVVPLRELTAKLLAGLARHRIPVTAFVNEGKLSPAGAGPEEIRAREALLQMWIAAGHELGNHTYSHPDLNTMTLDAFEHDLVRGEPVTRRLMEASGGKLRYFRHPFLHVGLELEKRRAFESFLAGRGYTIAPVTIDNDEWIFAGLYADALKRGDPAAAARLAEAYVPYMERVFEFMEGLSRTVVGREIPQVLLVHANSLNADHFPRIAETLARRGYRFVTLGEALRDPAYARPDTYVGQWGISWLHHWEITEGRKRTPSPDPPSWVLEAFQARGQ